MSVTETKRTHPIEAEITPPAPKYGLPVLIGHIQHDKRKNIAPAWSLAPKQKYEVNTNPGPGYNFDALLTNKGMQESPAYSMGSRHPAKGGYNNPAPGHYNISKRQGTLHHENTPPAYSMGALEARVKINNFVPGPNQYKLKGGIGELFPNLRNSAKYDIHGGFLYGGSHYEGLKLKGGKPGPAAYRATDPSIHKLKSPHYSVQGRTKQKNYNSSISAPAPGTYDPEKPRSGLFSGKSMGVRHSNYKISLITPMDVC